MEVKRKEALTSLVLLVVFLFSGPAAAQTSDTFFDSDRTAFHDIYDWIMIIDFSDGLSAQQIAEISAALLILAGIYLFLDTLAEQMSSGGLVGDMKKKLQGPIFGSGTLSSHINGILFISILIFLIMAPVWESLINTIIGTGGLIGLILIVLVVIGAFLLFTGAGGYFLGGTAEAAGKGANYFWNTSPVESARNASKSFAGKSKDWAVTTFTTADNFSTSTAKNINSWGNNTYEYCENMHKQNTKGNSTCDKGSCGANVP